MNSSSFRALASLLTLALPLGASAQSLLMVFRDKPPYSFMDGGVAKGFLLERTRRVLSAAGVEAQFQEMPPKRLFFEIEKNEQAICSFGWYKIPEREKFARFSVPLHQDKPHVVLVGPGSVGAVRKHGTLKELMADSTLVMAVADGVSYGPELDQLILKFAGKVDRSLQSPLHVVKKVAARRADHGRDEHGHVDPWGRHRLSADDQGAGASGRRGLRRLQQEQVRQTCIFPR